MARTPREASQDIEVGRAAEGSVSSLTGINLHEVFFNVTNEAPILTCICTHTNTHTHKSSLTLSHTQEHARTSPLARSRCNVCKSSRGHAQTYLAHFRPSRAPARCAHTHMHTRPHATSHKQTYERIHVHTRKSPHPHASAGTHKNTYTHTYTHTHTHT